MDAARPLCRWNTLRPVATSFIVQPLDTIALELQADGLVPDARIRRDRRAVLSSLAVGQLQIGKR